MKTTTIPARNHGMSLVEMLMTISIIAILSSLAISNFAGINEKSKASVAKELLERTNTAVHRFNETNYELVVNVATDGSDGMAVIRTLQYRKPVNPSVGSPYLANNWNPDISSSTLDYRLVWSRTLFKLVNPGDMGTGIKVDFSGAALTTPYTFPTGYTMAGK
ncbi:MAG: prepilin-type N-terminal cleavage/methylation domain-containing protein [Verrucomicrobiaceae bacterium]